MLHEDKASWEDPGSHTASFAIRRSAPREVRDSGKGFRDGVEGAHQEEGSGLRLLRTLGVQAQSELSSDAGSQARPRAKGAAARAASAKEASEGLRSQSDLRILSPLSRIKR